MSNLSCTHCGLEYPESAMIVEKEGDQTLYFCCKGCQGVYHLLKDEHLDSFYAKRGATTLEPPKPHADDTGRFDLESFRKKYIKVEGETSQISLILEGIHCAACVWLNEKVLQKLDGIVEVNINFTTHKAKIRWKHDKLPLSKIIEAIRSIGYNAYPYDPATGEERANKQRREYYTRMIVAIFATMNAMWLALARYLGYFTGMDPEVVHMIYVAETFLATPTLFYSGWVFFRGAYYGLRNRVVNMDFLVAAGASLTYFYSLYAAYVVEGGEAYFDSVIMIITFVLVGKFLEIRSKKTAVDTLDTLSASIPTEVTVVKEGIKTVKAIEEVEAGEIVEIKPGDKLVFDGKVLDGEASIDTSSLTGESVPVLARPGEKLLAGTVNMDGVLLMEVAKDYQSSTLYSIITLLEDSLAKKPKIEDVANRLSQHFALTILTIAAATFAWWYHAADLHTALITAVSVIVIACPCALALATPIATVVGVGAAAKRGILFKATRHIETMAQADALLIDKTGTLTEGKPTVTGFLTFEGYVPAEVLALVSTSRHPVAKGVAAHLSKEVDGPILPAEKVKAVQARGVEAVVNGKAYLGGNRAFLEERGVPLPGEEEGTHFYVAADNIPVALFHLEDALKPDAPAALKAIGKMGVETVMLTGDNEPTARKVAALAGITDVQAHLLPQEKAEAVDAKRKEGKTVVMAGDGINDAVALAKADIAIAMHSGADVAIDVSDVVLLDSSPTALKEAFTIARRTYGFVKQNLAISLVYNTLTIPLAVTGHVIPLVAALSMSLSSLIVVGNSMRIKRLPKEKTDD